MKSKTVHDFFQSSIGASLVGAAISVVLSTPAWSADFEKGDFSLSWDTTLAYGLNLRLDDPDPRIIGLANGGTAFSVNGDDGNLNYDTGVVNNLFKINSEVELRYRRCSNGCEASTAAGLRRRHASSRWRNRVRVFTARDEP